MLFIFFCALKRAGCWIIKDVTIKEIFSYSTFCMQIDGNISIHLKYLQLAADRTTFANGAKRQKKMTKIENIM